MANRDRTPNPCKELEEDLVLLHYSDLAGAAVVMLALTLTFGKGIWQSNDLPKDDAAMIEALPVAENLEFFKAMDVLDDLDLLESMGNQGDAA